MREQEITFVIPTFGGCPGRLTNLDFLLSKISKVSRNILVVEQVGQAGAPAKPLAKKYGVTHRRVKIDDDEVHKSRLINVGAAMANTPYVWVNDSDCYMKYDQILPTIPLYADFIQPYKIAKRLDKDSSERLKREEKVPIEFVNSKKIQYCTKASGHDQVSIYSALCFIFKKHPFNKIGKMDERYIGWGAEDTDLCYRAVTSTRFKFTVLDNKACHLWHPHPRDEPSFRSRMNNNFKMFEQKYGLKRKAIIDEIKKRYEMLNSSLGVVGIGRTGSSCLITTILTTTNIKKDGSNGGSGAEPFGTWGLQKKPKNKYRPIFFDQNPSDYIETVLQNEPYIKHLDYEVLQEQHPERLAFQRQATKRLVENRSIIIFTTRNNILDWIVSQILADKEQRFRKVYSGQQYEITREEFDYLSNVWREWHNETLPRLIEMRKAAGEPYHVIDYEQIADPAALKAFVLTHIPGASAERFRIPIRKQKTQPNESYITNYDQVLQWAKEEGVAVEASRLGKIDDFFEN